MIFFCLHLNKIALNTELVTKINFEHTPILFGVCMFYLFNYGFISSAMCLQTKLLKKKMGELNEEKKYKKLVKVKHKINGFHG